MLELHMVDRKDRVSPVEHDDMDKIRIAPIDCVVPGPDKRIDRPDRTVQTRRFQQQA